MSTPKKGWNPTKVQNLVRHQSGVYYARFQRDGKPVWKSLKTDVLSVAKPRLAKFLAEEKRKQELAKEMDVVESMTVADALKIHMEQVGNDPSTKSSTKDYW